MDTVTSQRLTDEFDQATATRVSQPEIPVLHTDGRFREPAEFLKAVLSHHYARERDEIAQQQRFKHISFPKGNAIGLFRRNSARVAEVDSIRIDQ